MCCLFGFVDYGHKLTRKQRLRLLSTLSTACEVRGTDATGIAYNLDRKQVIYKRPLPAHLMWYRVPRSPSIVMGHTRMATQGSELVNANNHPFPGIAGQTHFALAHNGVLTNDKTRRKTFCDAPIGIAAHPQARGRARVSPACAHRAGRVSHRGRVHVLRGLQRHQRAP